MPTSLELKDAKLFIFGYGDVASAYNRGNLHKMPVDTNWNNLVSVMSVSGTRDSPSYRYRWHTYPRTRVVVVTP